MSSDQEQIFTEVVQQKVSAALHSVKKRDYYKIWAVLSVGVGIIWSIIYGVFTVGKDAEIIRSFVEKCNNYPISISQNKSIDSIAHIAIYREIRKVESEMYSSKETQREVNAKRAYYNDTISSKSN